MGAEAPLMAVAPEHNPIYQCVGKRTYLNKKSAKRAARNVETAIGGGRLNHYQCPHCTRWHIGHPFRRQGENER